MWPLPSLRSTVPSAGQEAAPTKVTTPLMRFLTEKHTPKTPKRAPSKKVSTSEDRQGQMYAACWPRHGIQRTEISVTVILNQVHVTLRPKRPPYYSPPLWYCALLHACSVVLNSVL